MIEPFDPEILKSKVAVFVDLFKKTAEVKRQAAQLTAVNAELRESEHRFRSLSACSPVGIFLTDIRGECTYTNPRFQEIFSLTLEQCLGNGWWRSLHPENRDRVIAEWSAATRSGLKYSDEFCLLVKDTSAGNTRLLREGNPSLPAEITRWVHLRSAPLISDRGEPIGQVGTVEDITRRKQAEAEIYSLNADLEKRVIERTAQLEAANQQKDEVLQREQAARARAEAAEQRFRDLINGLGHAIFWEADATTLQFTFASQSAESILGYPLSKWTDETDFWIEILHPDDRQKTVDFFREQTIQGRDCEFEFRCIAANQQVLWLRNKAYIVRDSRGAVQKLRGLMTDITQAKQADDALKERAEELASLTDALQKTNWVLEKRNEELDRFAYVISHDLKAPLRAIANLSQWLEEDLGDRLAAETQHQMNLLRNRVFRMEKLIDGLLQYSRAGRVQVEMETIKIESLLHEVVDSLAPSPDVAIEIVPDMPTFTGARLLLFQVFSNLIGNAIKHRVRSDVWIKISAEKRDKFYEFSVADNGPGIAPQYHEKVFVIFQTLQSRSSLRDSHNSAGSGCEGSARSDNTGIGLSLVKKIVESEGGTVVLDSQEGRGTTVRFTWPISS